MVCYSWGAAWCGHLFLKVFWGGSREASGDALNKSSKFCHNLSVKNLRELKNRSLFTKIAFSCGENAGLVYSSAESYYMN